MLIEEDGRRWTAGEARRCMSASPTVNLDDLCGNGAVGIIAPHPDDESLGCGGLIALCGLTGRRVIIIFMTDGAGSHPGSRRFSRSRLAALRKREARHAAEILGTKNLIFMDVPDGCLSDHAASVSAGILDVLRLNDVQTLVAPWEADHHPDHKAAWTLASDLSRELDAKLYAYPIWGLILPPQADAGPRCSSYGLEVSSVLPQKCGAIYAHQSQTTDLIDDDPNGFRLRPADVARHLVQREIYLAPI